MRCFQGKTGLLERIANEILMTLRAAKKTANQVYFQEAIGSDGEGNELTLLDVYCTDADSVIDFVDRKIQCRKIYDKIDEVLTPREKTVICLRYGLYNSKEMTQKSIAEILGVSRSYISRIEKKSVQKLQKVFIE